MITYKCPRCCQFLQMHPINEHGKIWWECENCGVEFIIKQKLDLYKDEPTPLKMEKVRSKTIKRILEKVSILDPKGGKMK